MKNNKDFTHYQGSPPLAIRLPYPIVAILFKPFGFISPNFLNITLLSNLSTLWVHDDGYSNESFILNLRLYLLLFLCNTKISYKT